MDDGRLIASQWDVYKLTEKFPKQETHGLTSQIQRAIRSISENIVEGFGERTSKDFISYLDNAIGSVRGAGRVDVGSGFGIHWVG